MFIAKINSSTRLIESFFVPSSPLDINKYTGDPTYFFLDRTLFKLGKLSIIDFKLHYKKYKYTVNGKLEYTI